MTAVPGHVVGVGEGPHVREQVGAVPALHILHHLAEVLIALEAAVHRDDKGNVSKGRNFSLRKHLLWNLECSHLTVGLHSKLLKRKYRIFFLCVHVHRQIILQIPDFSEWDCVYWSSWELTSGESVCASPGTLGLELAVMILIVAQGARFQADQIIAVRILASGVKPCLEPWLSHSIRLRSCSERRGGPCPAPARWWCPEAGGPWPPGPRAPPWPSTRPPPAAYQTPRDQTPDTRAAWTRSAAASLWGRWDRWLPPETSWWQFGHDPAQGCPNFRCPWRTCWFSPPSHFQSAVYGWESWNWEEKCSKFNDSASNMHKSASILLHLFFTNFHLKS